MPSVVPVMRFVVLLCLLTDATICKVWTVAAFVPQVSRVAFPIEREMDDIALLQHMPSEEAELEHARRVATKLNADFNEEFEESEYPGLLMRVHFAGIPFIFPCGTCMKGGADCKSSAAFYHRRWSVAHDEGKGMGPFEDGQVMLPYGDKASSYAIVFNKKAVAQAIRCAYATDGDSDTRLGYGCGCDVLSHKEACRNNVHTDHPKIAECHCTSTSQAITIDEYPNTCYWKGPAFVHADGRRGANELSYFFRHRVNIGVTHGYQENLFHWTEVIIGARELTELIRKHASEAILAFAVPRLCDDMCVAVVLETRRNVSKTIPVIALNDMDAKRPFSAVSMRILEKRRDRALSGAWRPSKQF